MSAALEKLGCDPRGGVREPARAIIGEEAIERMSAAGLVITTAARMSALLDVVHAARALAESEWRMADALAGRSSAEQADPWPQADALVAALRGLEGAT